ncbi:TPA: TIGR03761 family integrating conjugative element protein [Salmonella enterica]|uniref:TIGR03761 family integrating conjugative element protein n=1 Tax=Salmonella enterica TaxID=28901 RepID=A0A756I0A9_SALER|nr:TIGR03761 family integrating conjugative element protein [Salmonella enterica]
MSDEQNPESGKAGALRSAMSVSLNTHYAIRLWEGRYPEYRGNKGGRQKESTRHRSLIFSMPGFIQKAGRINQDSASDNPWADAKMLELENLINAAIEKMQEELDGLKKVMSMVPAQVTISDITSVSPLNIGVFSRTPVGYRCVWLLVGFDQLAMQAFQAAHYGIISRRELNSCLGRGGYLVRQIYGAAQKYRYLPVTREDIAVNNDKAREAIKLFGKVDPDILSGKKRSSWSPPVNRRSVDALKRESPSEGRISSLRETDNDGSSEPANTSVLQQRQTEEASGTDDGRGVLTEDIDIDIDIDIDDLSVLIPPADAEPE